MRNGIFAALGLFALALPSSAQDPSPSEVLLREAVIAEPAPPRIWARADYLLFWVKDGPSNLPLFTTGPESSFGVPGRPGTVALFGGSGFQFGTTNGMRISAGWDASPGGFGVLASGFLLERRSTGNKGVASDAGVPLIASPIINPTTGMLTSGVENNPNIVVTGFVAGTTTQFWGSDINLALPTMQREAFSIRPIAGFRYLDLFETLRFNTTLFSRLGAGTLVTGSRLDQRGDFDTRSQFFGPQIGAIGEYRRGAWTLLGNFKLATGVSHETVDIRGAESVVAPDGQSRPDTSALYIMPTNAGTYRKNLFAVVPEVGLDAAYDVTENVRLSVGYSFLYWSNVVRPADQIDFVINTAQRFGVPPPRPIPLFETTDFWVHGVNFGMTLRY